MNRTPTDDRATWAWSLSGICSECCRRRSSGVERSDNDDDDDDAEFVEPIEKQFRLSWGVMCVCVSE